MFHSGICNTEFGNLRLSLYAIRLCCGLPNKRRYPYLLHGFSKALYCIYQHVRVWFGYIRSYHQTLSMLVQQHFQKTPFRTSLNLNYSARLGDVEWEERLNHA